MLRSTLLLALASLTVATDSVYFSAQKASQKGLPLLSGFSPRPQFLSMAATCEAGMKQCGNTCIESSGQCCDTTKGSYCEDGYRCQDDGCCEDGKLCSGPPTRCTDGKEMCGGYCIPKGKVCCLTGYCDEGEKCSSGGCSSGSSSSGSGGSSGGSSGGPNCQSYEEPCGDKCMPEGMVCCKTGYCLSGQTCTSDGKCQYGSGSGSSSGGSSGGSSEGSCASYQEECGEGCMPKGMVCCDTGYCLSGQVCSSDGTCRYGSSSGGSGGSSGGSSDDDDDSKSATRTFDTPSFTAPSIEPIPTLDDDTFPTFSSRPLPTGPRSGGDDGDSTSNSNSDGGSRGSIVVPSIFMGVIAMIPLLL